MRIISLDVNNSQSSTFRLHRESGTDDYLFVLFKSPTKVLEKGSYVSVDANNCILYGKKAFQSYYPADNNEFLHDFIHFDIENEYEENLLNSIPTSTVFEITVPNISTTLLDIKNEFYSRSLHKNDILSHLGAIFLCRLKDDININIVNYKKKALYKEFDLVKKNIYQEPHKDWSINVIAESLYISPSYFKHLYKKFFQVSCIDDVINARILLAKTLLMSGNHTIKAVSEKCGYNNVEHFIRQFKKETGQTPNKYRQLYCI